MGVGMYENVFSGNFIYALGVQIGITSCQGEIKKEISACVNLLQQTPLDPTFGDMLLSLQGVSLLIEFKSEKNKNSKEPEKHKLLKNDLGKNKEMGGISKLAHWFIQIDATKDLETKVVPYLEMDELNEADSFDSFIEKIVKKIFNCVNGGEIVDIGVTAEPMSKYLKYIKKLFGKNSGSSKSLGGLIINITPNGELKYVVVNDITKVLDLKMSQIREQDLEKTQGFIR